ncbi:hypothetical protein GWI33_011103 [Rhynchophorus ferrugineus]|uniref:Uncharacterized protein n=1 Tax=Rhynchophorus ferrugineus TaxID=354439 RepID=A0A834IWT5_RHYFE|nr:hypothetical protein GWI33_011103 [Rhynchophorus ferrugineus]
MCAWQDRPKCQCLSELGGTGCGRDSGRGTWGSRVRGRGWWKRLVRRSSPPDPRCPAHIPLWRGYPEKGPGFEGLEIKVKLRTAIEKIRGRESRYGETFA